MLCRVSLYSVFVVCTAVCVIKKDDDDDDDDDEDYTNLQERQALVTIG